MLRKFLIVSGILNILVPIISLLFGRTEFAQPGIGLVGVLCLAVAEVTKRVERIEKYIALRDANQSGPASDFMFNDLDAVPVTVEKMASKLRNVIAKQSKESVSIDAIERQGNNYRISLLIGHAVAARKKTALVPIVSAHEVAPWQKAATDIMQSL